MDDIPLVQVVNTKAYVNEHFPDEVISHRPSVLLLDQAVEVVVLAVLHHDVDLRVHNKRVEVAHNEVTVDCAQEINFV